MNKKKSIQLKLDIQELAEALSLMLLGVSENVDEDNEALQHILMILKEGKLHILASNGFKFSYKTFYDCHPTLNDYFSIVIPQVLVRRIISCLYDYKMTGVKESCITLKVTTKTITMLVGSKVILNKGKLYKQKYPYQDVMLDKIVPSLLDDKPEELRVYRKDLLETIAINRTAWFVKLSQSMPLNLHISLGGMSKVQYTYTIPIVSGELKTSKIVHAEHLISIVESLSSEYLVLQYYYNHIVPDTPFPLVVRKYTPSGGYDNSYCFIMSVLTQKETNLK